MKKILALLLAVMMLLTLTACKSKEQKAADKYLKELEEFMDELIDTAKDGDVSAVMGMMEEAAEFDEKFQEIYEDLEKVDEDAAEEFKEEYEKLGEKAEEAMSDLY